MIQAGNDLLVPNCPKYPRTSFCEYLLRVPTASREKMLQGGCDHIPGHGDWLISLRRSHRFFWVLVCARGCIVSGFFFLRTLAILARTLSWCPATTARLPPLFLSFAAPSLLRIWFPSQM
ncbi:hypothetical protein F5B20DRAFT_566933 [Whalleya microplaca]|nr:hypothetical protein F5B20DRAFT_566933 [Whalleya microplaca]